MNGAAMDYQEQAPCPLNKDPSSLQSCGYRLQTNHPSQQQNSPPQYSKTMNYHSDPYLVHGSSEYLQTRDFYDNDFEKPYSGTSDIWDTRFSSIKVREPMELPVPQFEIDENYVGIPPRTSDTEQKAKDLDLDTRINLLIKSKALSGMHPIFSELNESEDSGHSSDENSLIGMNRRKHKAKKLKSIHKANKQPSEVHSSCYKRFDDPEVPLSRPPSPFLSRATYLFWFNKAIELKQQAKAQEQALLEKAAKKLIQNNLSTEKTKSETPSKQESDALVKSLLKQVGKELKEVIRQDFIKEIIEKTAFDSLENWWEEQKDSGKDNVLHESSLVSSTTDENGKLVDQTTDESSHNTVRLDINDVHPDAHRSTSPKMPFPWKNIQESEKKSSTKNTGNSKTNDSEGRIQHLTSEISNQSDSKSETLETINNTTSASKSCIESISNISICKESLSYAAESRSSNLENKINNYNGDKESKTLEEKIGFTNTEPNLTIEKSEKYLNNQKNLEMNELSFKKLGPNFKGSDAIESKIAGIVDTHHSTSDNVFVELKKLEGLLVDNSATRNINNNQETNETVELNLSEDKSNVEAFSETERITPKKDEITGAEDNAHQNALNELERQLLEVPDKSVHNQKSSQVKELSLYEEINKHNSALTEFERVIVKQTEATGNDNNTSEKVLQGSDKLESLPFERSEIQHDKQETLGIKMHEINILANTKTEKINGKQTEADGGVMSSSEEALEKPNSFKTLSLELPEIKLDSKITLEIKESSLDENLHRSSEEEVKKTQVTDNVDNTSGKTQEG